MASESEVTCPGCGATPEQSCRPSRGNEVALRSHLRRFGPALANRSFLVLKRMNLRGESLRVTLHTAQVEMESPEAIQESLYAAIVGM